MGERRSVLIVGPGQYFGSELVAMFAQRGYRVGVVAKRRATIDQLQELSAVQEPLVNALADIADEKELASALVAVLPELTPLDLVIYNAKLSPKGPVERIARREIEDAVRVNVGAVVQVMQMSLPYLEGSPRPVIVVTGGGYKDNPDASKLALSASKAALHNLVLGLAPTFATRGISLKTIVIDGPVRSGGIIRPQDVVTAFWNAYAYDDRRVIYVRPSVARCDQPVLPLQFGYEPNVPVELHKERAS